MKETLEDKTMKPRLHAQKPPQPVATPIRTTFMELLQELNSLTKDDSLVMAAVKSIFDSYRVRFGHSLATVRLVDSGFPIRARTIAGRRRSAWA